MTNRWISPGDDRGAVLIHVALGVLMLTAFLTFVADFGLMWTARRQAQNSADAGAIAGATALGYDDPTDFSDTGAAKLNAYHATQQNIVWGQSPHVDITQDITFPLLPTADCDPDGDGVSQCVRVQVFRNADQLNALPMLFGQIVGLTGQNTQASAVAVVAAANQSKCLKPWGVADKWAEADGSWDPTDTFDPAAGDNYRYQGENGPQDPGTGFKAPPTTPNDYGVQITLKVGSPHRRDQPRLVPGARFVQRPRRYVRERRRVVLSQCDRHVRRWYMEDRRLRPERKREHGRSDQPRHPGSD